MCCYLTACRWGIAELLWLIHLGQTSKPLSASLMYWLCYHVYSWSVHCAVKQIIFHCGLFHTVLASILFPIYKSKPFIPNSTSILLLGLDNVFKYIFLFFFKFLAFCDLCIVNLLHFLELGLFFLFYFLSL